MPTSSAGQLQIVVGKRGLEEGTIELRRRRTGEKRDMDLSVATELFSFAKKHLFNREHGDIAVSEGLFS